MVKDFEIIGNITDVETIAVSSSIHILKRLKRFYGTGRWRKLKGIAKVKLPDSTVFMAEVHLYESSGTGRKEIKIKRLL